MQGVHHIHDSAADLVESFVPPELGSVRVEAPTATDLIDLAFRARFGHKHSVSQALWRGLSNVAQVEVLHSSHYWARSYVSIRLNVKHDPPSAAAESA